MGAAAGELLFYAQITLDKSNLIFAAVIIPQLIMNTAGNSGGGLYQNIFSFIFLGLAILYLVIFSMTAVHFYQYEKLVSGDKSGIRLKYVGVFALIVVLIAGIGVLFWMSYR